MRLIDKDLVLKTAKDKEWGLWCEIANIKFAPEVKAIPIEWIKKYIQKLNTILKDNLDLGEEGPADEIVAIESMLNAWEKENEID